jgi:hypothetical protein
MLANAIPIYLGAPNIVEHFNPSSFIQVSDKIEDTIAKIREIDEDPVKWKRMMSESWLKDNQISSVFHPSYSLEHLRKVLQQPQPLVNRNLLVRPLRHILPHPHRPRTRLMVPKKK